MCGLPSLYEAWVVAGTRSAMRNMIALGCGGYSKLVSKDSEAM